MRWRSRWLVAALVSAALVLAACGDDDATATSAAEEDSVGSTDDTGTDDDDAASDDLPSGDGEAPDETGSGEAVVEIGDERWMFSMDLGCQANFGSLAGGGTATDGSGAQFEVLIPPEDYESKPDEGWSPPRVRVVLADGSSWFAAAEQGQGELTAFANDGQRASGEGTFQHDGGESADGSFSFSCP